MSDDLQSVLPVGRIKSLMRSDEDVRMISAETPVLFSRACELFITELTQAANAIAEEQGSRVIDHAHVMEAIMRHDRFDFLRLVMPADPDAIAAAEAAHVAELHGADALD